MITNTKWNKPGSLLATHYLAAPKRVAFFFPIKKSIIAIEHKLRNSVEYVHNTLWNVYFLYMPFESPEDMQKRVKEEVNNLFDPNFEKNTRQWSLL